jgi:hypothetical protein
LDLSRWEDDLLLDGCLAGDEALADSYPALFTHYNKKDATVQEMLSDGLQQSFVLRMSAQARAELALIQQALNGITIHPAPDKRITPFIKGDWGLDSGALYRLLKARGQPEDPRAVFIWHNSAPPRVQLFMWLLLQRRI